MSTFDYRPFDEQLSDNKKDIRSYLFTISNRIKDIFK